MTEAFNLKKSGITVENILRNAPPSLLYEEAIKYEENSAIADSGALMIYSGNKTGRSPGDKRIVRSPESENDIHWGKINMEIDDHTFEVNHERAIDYLNTCSKLYVFDGFAGWDKKYSLKVRIVCTRAYHALFMHNMLIRPHMEDLENFGEPDYVIYNAGRFPANKHTSYMTSKTSVDLSFEKGEMVILGTEYAGEMKKGVFTIMNYIMPKREILSMHCSTNEGDSEDDVTVFFGLSGTGKTTLSADPKRKLIGDDEHCWSDDGIFNIEGGCYAKSIHLSKENEPDIYKAIRFGTVLENVVFSVRTHHVDYDDDSITENTRASYPIRFIKNAKIPCVCGHPKNIVFLTCDAYGVLPPVSRLTPEQSMYQFISGYTAKVAGTEMGVTEPQATFSACFGEAFMVWHPSKYAELLAEKIRKHNTKVWLVNTGWTGGGYGVGNRMSLPHTRSIIDAIHDGSLEKADFQADPRFCFDVPTSCNGVPSEILSPRNSWKNGEEYDATAKKLAELFHANFKQYAEQAHPDIAAAGPKLD